MCGMRRIDSTDSLTKPSEFSKTPAHDGTALITSVGSGVGIEMLNALRRTRATARIVGANSEAFAAGIHACDAGYLLPPAREADAYRHHLTEIVRQERPCILYPGHDAELPILAAMRNMLWHDYGCFPVVGALAAVDVCNDKYGSYVTLRDLKFGRSAIHSADIDALIEETGWPVVVKPRVGFASHNILVAFSHKDVHRALTLPEPMVVQEFLVPLEWGIAKADVRPRDVHRNGRLRQEDEYSVQLLIGEGDAILGHYSSRNTLRFGMPFFIETIDLPALESAARAIGARLAGLGLIGPLNIQAIRIGENDFRIVELNARFTGITSIRTAMGFMECEAVWRHFVEKRPHDGCLTFTPGLCAARRLEADIFERKQVDALQERGTWHPAY